MTHNPLELPANLPVPTDDGAAAHLPGQALPALTLDCTDGSARTLTQLPETTVLFFYPRTGVPGQPPHRGFHGEDWDDIPGARGCTPQNCAFRDLQAEFDALGVTVFGVSTQTREHQVEFRARNHVAFHSLSDVKLELTCAMRLPTFEFPVESGGPNTLIRRMGWLVHRGRIQHVWYPVFPPNQHAQRVLHHLRAHPP
jgi:peroxiredoxin